MIVQIDPIIESHNKMVDFVHHMLIHICLPSEDPNKQNKWDKYLQPRKYLYHL